MNANIKVSKLMQIFKYSVEAYIWISTSFRYINVLTLQMFYIHIIQAVVHDDVHDNIHDLVNKSSIDVFIDL